jgi:hypothetical protein
MHITMVQTYYNSRKVFKSYDLAKFVNPNELASKVLTDQLHACIAVLLDGHVHGLYIVTIFIGYVSSFWALKPGRIRPMCIHIFDR